MGLSRAGRVYFQRLSLSFSVMIIGSHDNIIMQFSFFFGKHVCNGVVYNPIFRHVVLSGILFVIFQISFLTWDIKSREMLCKINSFFIYIEILILSKATIMDVWDINSTLFYTIFFSLNFITNN